MGSSNPPRTDWLIPYHQKGIEYHQDQIDKTRELIAKLALEGSGQMELFDDKEV